mmetsp:Transcript_104749/g.273460  ORF Transcript_104749/g.273460 Transcript_104749/m.273460 type:complete len:227 (-) Transcript_104749:223-903(-)
MRVNHLEEGLGLNSEDRAHVAAHELAHVPPVRGPKHGFADPLPAAQGHPLRLPFLLCDNRLRLAEPVLAVPFAPEGRNRVLEIGLRGGLPLALLGLRFEPLGEHAAAIWPADKEHELCLVPCVEDALRLGAIPLVEALLAGSVVVDQVQDYGGLLVHESEERVFCPVVVAQVVLELAGELLGELAENLEVGLLHLVALHADLVLKVLENALLQRLVDHLLLQVAAE